MVATLAGAVVSAVVGAVVTNVVAQAFKLVEKRYELWKDFTNDMDFIKRELLMITGAEEDQLAGKGDPSAVRSVSMEEMRDLAHDIEDCLDRILRSTEGKNKEASLQFADEVKDLIKRLKVAHQRKTDYNVDGAQLSSATRSTAVSSLQSFRPVGIDKPKIRIVELLKDDAESQPENPKVISIVGFGGSGKTTLAKEVYRCKEVEDQFPCRAWVVASEHGGDTKALLTELFHKFYPGEQAGEDVEQLQTKISNYLSNKRCLIVLDDIKEENWWHCIKSTFSDNTKSRIIVTTTIQTVAKVCSRENGYVHNMKTLDDNHSKELLRSVLEEHSPGLEQSSTSIVNKCDGHPLSLDTVAHYLARKDVITEGVCEQLSRSLGHRVATEDAFLKLREVLMNIYTSLPAELPNIKTCLMYMCVFPNGCHIKRSRLMRRWQAEHYVQHEYPRTSLEVADEYFMKLVDRNIISPIEASKNRVVKSCRAHGIVHEFMLHMSKSAKFITSLGDPERRNYRHLFKEGRLSTSSGRSSYQIHSHDSPTQDSKFGDKDKKTFPFFKEREKEKAKEEKKLRAHSLTICGNAGEAVGEFLNCELLRVLDLEECDDLKDEDIDGIHDLWHLKYLSLGATISRLPREIQKLYCLETLDVRKTKKEIILPVVVIKLPHLAHLLGKFKLEKNWKKNKAEKNVPEESNLQTLAGFVTNDDPGFPMLMVRMKKLQKVKVWCNSDSEELLDAIKKFVRNGMDTCDDRSLSLYLGDSTRNFLSSLESSLKKSNGYLSSLKIRGALGAPNRLTLLTTSLYGLKELCLSSTMDLRINDIELSNLGRLRCLEYLKLVKVSLGGLVIGRQHFPGLLCLCLVQSPALPTVENGALLRLVSLQLLAEDLRDLSGIKIEQHKLLQEVALDSKVNKETRTILENAAQKHPKRPRVLYFDKVDPNETGSIVKYVAAKRTAPETGSSVVQEEQQIRVQSIGSNAMGSTSSSRKTPKSMGLRMFSYFCYRK